MLLTSCCRVVRWAVLFGQQGRRSSTWASSSPRERKQYLEGRPAAAYITVQAAIAQVQAVNHLISVEVQPADLPVLFRMTGA